MSCFYVVVFIAELWTFILEDVTSKWIGFVAGCGCCVFAIVCAYHIKALCRKE